MFINNLPVTFFVINWLVYNANFSSLFVWWCLTPLSTIFQLYRGGPTLAVFQLYRCWLIDWCYLFMIDWVVFNANFSSFSVIYHGWLIDWLELTPTLAVFQLYCGVVTFLWIFQLAAIAIKTSIINVSDLTEDLLTCSKK
jgi:hypothetical protein